MSTGFATIKQSCRYNVHARARSRLFGTSGWWIISCWHVDRMYWWCELQWLQYHTPTTLALLLSPVVLCGFLVLVSWICAVALDCKCSSNRSKGKKQKRAEGNNNYLSENHFVSVSSSSLEFPGREKITSKQWQGVTLPVASTYKGINKQHQCGWQRSWCAWQQAVGGRVWYGLVSCSCKGNLGRKKIKNMDPGKSASRLSGK